MTDWDRLVMIGVGAVVGVFSAALAGAGGWLALELARAKAEEAKFKASLRSMAGVMAGR
jgi:hypothetical protein